MSTGGKGGGQNLPQGELGRTVLADGVGLLGNLRDAVALQHDRVGEGLDARFGHAHFFRQLRRGGAGADAVLDLRRADLCLFHRFRFGGLGQADGRSRRFLFRGFLLLALQGLTQLIGDGEEKLFAVFGAQHQRGFGRLAVNWEQLAHNRALLLPIDGGHICDAFNYNVKMPRGLRGGGACWG